MPTLRIYLLGNPYVTVDDQVISFRRKKALALVAYLACTGKPCHRETLISLFWPDNDEEYGRAALRRTLAAITETALRPWLIADRNTVHLDGEPVPWVDTALLRQSLQQDTEARVTAVALYRDSFMAGFSLDDSPAFDTWQAMQAQLVEGHIKELLSHLTEHYIDRRMFVSGLEAAHRWLQIDALHEGAHYALMRLLALSNQGAAAWQHFQTYARTLQEELGVEPSAALHNFATALEQGLAPSPVRIMRIELLPPPPSLVMGRAEVLAELQARLLPDQHQANPELVIQGWPGIGKTTLSTVLAYDKRLHTQYPDGVLWAALGENPNVRGLLSQWMQAAQLGTPDPGDSVETLTSRLRTAFAQRSMLLIVDDVWEVAHALPFRVGSQSSALLMSTRFNDVARALVSRADSLYKVPIIADDDALRLIYTLAPSLVDQPVDTLRILIHELEGLPLALQVAGRLLQSEASMGWGVSDLIEELRDGQRLLLSQAPADRHEVAIQTSPTIAALLQRSIDRLSPELQEYFALLGVFAPKPASFTLDAVKAIWHNPQPQGPLRTLCDRGLLEPGGNGRFQMHALLVMHARTMFQD